jgi:organic radical activating enzyme
LTKELVIDCHNNHKLTSIETNGIYWNDVIKNITYVTVSPKLGHPVCPAVASCLIDEVRYTIDEDTTDLWDCTTGRPCNSIKNLWPYFVTGITAAAVCISPIFNNTAPPTPNKKALETSLALVNKNAPVARLSLQVHKFIGVR